MARGFALYDYLDRAESGPVKADGTCTHMWGPPDAGHIWVVELIAVFSTSALNGPAGLWLDDSTVPVNFRGGTATGIGDVDTGAKLMVPTARQLLIVWEGLTPGSVCTSVLQYRDLITVGIPSDNSLAAAVAAGAGTT